MDGNPPLKLSFSLRSNVDTLLNEEKRSSGNAFIPVDSRWSVVRAESLFMDVGKSPAGTWPFPTNFKDCKPVNPPSSLGIIDGTAGKDKSLKWFP